MQVPISVESPDPSASPKEKKAKVAKTTKAKAAKPASPPVPPDPASQLAHRLQTAFANEDLTNVELIKLCWNEIKDLLEEDADYDAKRIAWLKTVFDDGFDDLYRLMTDVPHIIKRLRRWLVASWKADKNSPIILYTLQVSYVSRILLENSPK